MSVDFFMRFVAAVFVGNMLTLVVVYGVWRAGRAEKKLGIRNGADALPLALLVAMIVPFAVTGWAVYSLQ